MEIDWLMFALGVALLACGFIGCVVPVLPGPIFGYAAVLALLPTDRTPSAAVLAAGAAIVAAVTALDYLLPSVFARKFKCSGSGVFGCVVGTVVGLFFMPVGLVAGPFLGTMAGELIAGRRLSQALKGGVGALLGYVATLALKLAAVSYFAVVFAKAAFG